MEDQREVALEMGQARWTEPLLQCLLPRCPVTWPSRIPPSRALQLFQSPGPDGLTLLSPASGPRPASTLQGQGAPHHLSLRRRARGGCVPASPLPLGSSCLQI